MRKLNRKKQFLLLLGLLLILTVSFVVSSKVISENQQRNKQTQIETQKTKAECKDQKVASNECLFVGCNGFF